MDEEGKWIVGHFWQRILGSDKQAGFIKSAEDPGYGSKLRENRIQSSKSE